VVPVPQAISRPSAAPTSGIEIPGPTSNWLRSAPGRAKIRMVHEIWRLDQARTRSISAENPTGAPGQGGRATTGTGADAARDLGVGWKVSPSILLASGATATLADITGP